VTGSEFRVYGYLAELEMKVFENHTRNLKVGQNAEDFPIDESLSLADLKGHPIFLVFWKTL